MRKISLFLCITVATVLPAHAGEFLGIELCQDSKTTAVVLPPDSQLILESVEIGKHGGLVMLLKAEDGDVLDHIDNLMSRYTGSRGTGDRKTLQWAGREITNTSRMDNCVAHAGTDRWGRPHPTSLNDMVTPFVCY